MDPETGIPYGEEERRIYRYSAGGREMRADPLAAMRRIRQAARDRGVDLEHEEKTVRAMVEAGRVGAELPGDMVDAYYEALGRIAAVARDAFGVPDAEADPGGWTEAEALDALYGFLGWMKDLREGFTTTPSSADSPTSASTASEAGPAAACPTGPSSGCGSTATG